MSWLLVGGICIVGIVIGAAFLAYRKYVQVKWNLSAGIRSKSDKIKEMKAKEDKAQFARILKKVHDQI